MSTPTPSGAPRGLPLRGSIPRSILAAHDIWTGYGHWLSNDLRGSGSTEIRKDELKDLGPVHFGRKKIQPTRDELRKFYREAEPLLEHPVLWFDEEKRYVIARAFAAAAGKFKYTLWAYASCSNHSHAVIRTHRDRSEVIWQNLANASRDALLAKNLIPPNHPLWAHRPYKVFLYNRPDVLGRIDYVNDNPEKEGLPRQHWGFIVPCPY